MPSCYSEHVNVPFGACWWAFPSYLFRQPLTRSSSHVYGAGSALPGNHSSWGPHGPPASQECPLVSFLSLEMVNPPYIVSASWFQSGDLISIFDIPSGIQNIHRVQFPNDRLLCARHHAKHEGIKGLLFAAKELTTEWYSSSFWITRPAPLQLLSPRPCTRLSLPCGSGAAALLQPP